MGKKLLGLRNLQEKLENPLFRDFFFAMPIENIPFFRTNLLHIGYKFYLDTFNSLILLF